MDRKDVKINNEESKEIQEGSQKITCSSAIKSRGWLGGGRICPGRESWGGIYL